MYKERKFIKILRTFSPSVLNRFTKFTESPYFNSNQKIIDLVGIVVDLIKNEPDSVIDDQVINNAIFKNGDFKDIELRKVLSDGLKLFQNFLGIEYFQNSENIKLATEFKSIQENRLQELYSNYQKAYNSLADKTLERGGDFFYYQFQNEKTNFGLKSEFEMKNKKIKEVNVFNFLKMSENLEKFYLYEQIKILVNIESWKRIRNISIEHPHKNRILSMYDKSSYKSEPLISIFHLLYFIYIHPDESSYYFELRQKVSKHKYAIPTHEIRNVYEALISYSVNKINKGISDFVHESFEVYKEALESEYYLIHGYLNPSDYRNIIVIGLRAGEIKWVKNFIEEYKEKISPEYRHNSYFYALTTFSFYQKEFDKVIELLQKVEYEDVWYNINSKTMLLAAYFELQEFEALDNLINSFKVFISREKTLTKNRKRNYLNYLKFINNLSKLDISSNKDIEELESKIKATPGVVSKSWLLEKLRELK